MLTSDHVQQAKDGVLRSQAGEARAAKVKAQAARAEGKVATLEAKGTVMVASSAVGSSELISAQYLVLKIKEWRECVKKAQCSLQKQELLIDNFAVYQSHTSNAFFFASVKPNSTHNSHPAFVGVHT